MHPNVATGVVILTIFLQAIKGYSLADRRTPWPIDEQPSSIETSVNVLPTTETIRSWTQISTSKCPSTCKCTVTKIMLRIQDCATDPGSDLDALILENLNVTSLVIVRSKLSRLPRIVCKIAELRHLNVSYNRLSDLPWDCLRHLSLREIDASHNQIKHLRSGASNILHHRNNINLSNNKICDVQHRISWTGRRRFNMNINCSNQKRIKKSVSDNCPNGCKCYDKPDQKVIVVNCSHGELQYLPDTLPERPSTLYRYDLDFTTNKLEFLVFKSYLGLVRNAHFSHNNISVITLNFIKGLAKVSQLYLNSNHLGRLPGGIQDINMTHVEEILLSDNHWICDCHELETRSWILKFEKVIKDHEGIYCQNPNSMKGYNLPDTPENWFVCKTNWHYSYILTGVGGPLIMLLAIFSFMSIVYVNRILIYTKIRWHPFDDDECSGEGMEADVFVCFADAEREYGHDYLIPELERRGYKVSEQRTHFVAGRQISDNIEECIKFSKRTILVLSNKFLERYWCKYELNAAIKIDKEQNTSRLICITHSDELNTDGQEDLVKTYLKKKYCIKSDAKDFWTYLGYYLASKKMGKSQPNAPELPLMPREHYEAPCTPPMGGENEVTALLE